MILRITSPTEWAEGRIDDDGEGFVHLSHEHQVLTAANTYYKGQRNLLLLVLDEAKLGEIRVEGGFPHLYDALTAEAVLGIVDFPCDDDGAFRLALVPVHAGSPPASDLLAAMVAFLADLNGPVDPAAMPTAEPDEMWAPSGTFLVGWDETGTPVCCGGVKRLDDGLAEIKRMFVAPDARSRGHARRVLAGLEDAARRLGYERVRLDTGPDQPHAKALYTSAGYVEIANYNANPIATYFGEKQL